MGERRYPICAISRMRIGTDGQGVRTLVAMKGCPLRCKYCINKFTWDDSVEPKLLTAEELYSKIRRDITYMRATNGGITFGGGEPLLYPELIKEFRDICGEDISIFVETSLNVPWESVATVIDIVDKFIIDIKTMDEETYKEYTGYDCNNVVSNMKKLIENRCE